VKNAIGFHAYERQHFADDEHCEPDVDGRVVVFVTVVVVFATLQNITQFIKVYHFYF
jgi:hypothetical protein